MHTHGLVAGGHTTDAITLLIGSGYDNTTNPTDLTTSASLSALTPSDEGADTHADTTDHLTLSVNTAADLAISLSASPYGATGHEAVAGTDETYTLRTENVDPSDHHSFPTRRSSDLGTSIHGTLPTDCL